jgi:hypothetical protein
MDNMEILKSFLSKCNIIYETPEQLDGTLIPRDILISKDKFESLKEDIDTIRKIYSSGSLTSLQRNASDTQKWPLLNLVRQMLKINDYKMEPIRKSDGYNHAGKKKYVRYFMIKKNVKTTSKTVSGVN